MKLFTLSVSILFILLTQVTMADPPSYRSGIALSKFLESTYRHKYEIVESGEELLRQQKIFPLTSRSEWMFLNKHLLNYLRIHDDPKIWERDKLDEFGYPKDLPVVKAFLAQNYGVSFTSLGGEHMAFQVRDAMNLAESHYKDLWMMNQKLNQYQRQSLMFWETFLDILVTKLSVDRAKELGFKYEPGSASEWFISRYSDKFKDQMNSRKDGLFGFEDHYFNLALKRNCVSVISQ